MNEIALLLIALLPIGLVVYLFREIGRTEVENYEFSITDYIGKFFQQEFNKAQGWKGAGDFK